MKIQKHRLSGQQVTFRQSPNHGGKFAKGFPDAIIIHYTAGASFSSSLNTLCDPKSKVSAHLLIGRNGEIAQMVPFDTKAWHAGRSSYKGRNGYNNYSIGIELDNAGMLSKEGNDYVSWFGRFHSEKDVIEAVHRNETRSRFWHQYTKKQLQLVETLCNILCSHYGIKEILGHEEIAPLRKSDPGPAFPLDELRKKLMEEKSNEKDAPSTYGIIKASALNVRSTGSKHGELQGPPLPKGTKVEVLEKKANWYRVKYQKEGWVFGKYVDIER